MRDCTVLDSHNCTVLDSHKWIVTLVLEWQSRSCGGAFSARLLLYARNRERCITSTANQFADILSDRITRSSSLTANQFCGFNVRQNYK